MRDRPSALEKHNLKDVPRWARLVATVGGAGYSPVGPGTMGALCALPFAVALGFTPVWVQLVVLVGISLLGWLAGEMICQKSPDQDPQIIVIDEFAGILLTFIAIEITWWTVPLGFVLFRFFDITKPFPVGYLDKNVKGGLGVMLDDLAAGAISLILLHVCVWLV